MLILSQKIPSYHQFDMQMSIKEFVNLQILSNVFNKLKKNGVIR